MATISTQSSAYLLKQVREVRKPLTKAHPGGLVQRLVLTVTLLKAFKLRGAASVGTAPTQAIEGKEQVKVSDI